MGYKATYIDIGYGEKWPTEVLLLSLDDNEIGGEEWWHRMSILQNTAAQTSDEKLLKDLDKAKIKRYGKGFPQQEVTTPQNMPSRDLEECLNYYAPQQRLGDMLCQKWFDEVSADKEKYTAEWRLKFVESLMESEHRDFIAKQWSIENKRDTLKCILIGSLKKTGVLKGTYSNIARKLDFKNQKPETLAEYMGYCRKVCFMEWVEHYVKK